MMKSGSIIPQKSITINMHPKEIRTIKPGSVCNICFF